MDLISLISRNSVLQGHLKSLGLENDQIVSVGGELNRQLRGADGLELTDLLSGLDVQGFLDRLDATELAGRVGLDPERAKTIIESIAPVVQAFDGSGGSAARRLLGGLFSRR